MCARRTEASGSGEPSHDNTRAEDGTETPRDGIIIDPLFDGLSERCSNAVLLALVKVARKDGLLDLP